MRQAWRLTTWHDPGGTGFTVEIDGNEAQLISTASGLILRLPYLIRAVYLDADSQQPPAELITLEGWFGLDSEGIALTGHVPSQIVMPNASYLDVPVTHELLASLDSARGTGDVLVKILLGGIARTPRLPTKKRYADVQSKTPSQIELPADVRAVRSDSLGPSLKIGRERWLELLAAAGRRRYRVVELPIPESRILGQIAATLDRAVLYLRRGDWRDAVAKSREIVEGIIVELSNHWGVPRPTDGSTTKWARDLGHRLANSWPDDQASGELLGNLLGAAWAWTAEDHHYSPSATSKRIEAEFAIGLAADLFLLANELMERHRKSIANVTSH
jgi:hypothetical protein